MVKYYCPYCPTIHQIHKLREDGVMVCGYCGDPLVRIQKVKPRQVLAIIAVFAFVSPLLMMVVSFVKEKKPPISRPQQIAMEVFQNKITFNID